MEKKETVIDFDFGFTAVSEDELDVVREAQEQTETLTQQLEATDERARQLYDAIMPLINNLKANPDKDYIYWPNRYEKLDSFSDKLYQIMSGES